MTTNLQLNMDQPRIIAFCGRAGCGKSTAARTLLQPPFQLRKWGRTERVSFAEPIRDALSAIGVSVEALTNPALKEQPLPGFGGKSPRYLMQTLGTEWGRQMVADDIWLQIARSRIQALVDQGVQVVIDDVRFDNEAQLLRDMGALIIEIRRKGDCYEDASAHASEMGIHPRFISETIVNGELNVFQWAVLCYKSVLPEPTT